MKSRNRKGGNAAFLAPLYLFTLVFLIGPFVYMIVLSFLTRAETWGVVNEFTLSNYAKILKPLYLSTFGRSFTFLAGIPATTAYGSTSCVTTQPAQQTAPSPI